MQHSRFTKIAVRATAALAALLLGMAVLSVLERRRTQAELDAVLSAFFSDAVLRYTRVRVGTRHSGHRLARGAAVGILESSVVESTNAIPTSFACNPQQFPL